jgi:hypothetical protein
MNKKIQKILEDVYRVAPELREEEAEIVEIVSEMLKKVPNIEPDKNFIKRLREILNQKIQAKELSSSKGNLFLVWYKRFFASAMGAVIVLLIVFSFLSNNGVNNKDSAMLFSKANITRVGENAFGVLENISNSNQSSSSETSINPLSSKMIGTGGGIGGGGGVATESSDAAVTMPYIPVQYVYVYKGEDFTQSEAKMDVLKRVVNADWGAGMSDFVQNMNFSIFDLSGFSNLKVNNINITEDQDFGYQVNVDMTRGNISLYKDWQRWPNLYANCQDASCYDSLRLKLSETPDDQAIIAETDKFLASHNIDTSIYDSPRVDKQSAVFEQTGVSYVSDEIQVVYPLKMNGVGVYESYGNVYGINVSYDIRNSRVSAVNNLMTQNYQSSAYEVETDVKNIIDMAESTDREMYAQNAEVAEKIEVELGTPSLVYAKYWQYKDSGEEEYLVPAFAFPVISNDKTSGVYRKNIIVPLVKSFWQQYYGPLMKSSEAAG